MRSAATKGSDLGEGPSLPIGANLIRRKGRFPRDWAATLFVANRQKFAHISGRETALQRLTEQILAHAKGFPEGTPAAAKSVLHLGNRAAMDQGLSRLAKRGQLLRAGRSVYPLPVTGRVGAGAPSVDLAVVAIVAQHGEVIVSSGVAAANRPGLTTQVPARSVYLTSERSRKMRLGKQLAGIEVTEPVPFGDRLTAAPLSWFRS